MMIINRRRLSLIVLCLFTLAGTVEAINPPPADPYADSVDSADSTVIWAEAALGLPDEQLAIITGAPFNGSGGATYDMGAAEPGLGYARLHYLNTDRDVPVYVIFYDADRQLITDRGFTIPAAASTGGIAELTIPATPDRAWRYIYISASQGRALFLDAIEAASYEGARLVYLPLVMMD